MVLPAEAPPANLDAERALLECALAAPTFTMPLAKEVECADFASTRHQVLWGALRRLHADHGDFDAFSLRTYLSEKGMLEQGGGDEYVSSLLTPGISGSTADLYIKGVREAAAQRDAYAAGVRLIEAANEQRTAQELLGLLERETAYARAVHSPRKSPWGGFDGDALVLEPEDQLTHFWPGLVVSQHVLLLAGTAKTGKSWLLYALLGALSRGEPWLGHPALEPIRAYIVSEEPRSRVRAKLARFGVKGSHGLARGDIPSNAKWPETVEYAGAEAKRLGCRILMFDTLAGLAQMEEENSNSEGNRALHPILQVAGKQDLAGIVTHHAPNSLRRAGGRPSRLLRAVDFVRGAGSLAANPDALAGIDNDENPDGPRRVIVAEGRFDLPALRVVVEYRRPSDDGTPATYEIVGRPAEVKDREAADADLLKAHKMDTRILGLLSRSKEPMTRAKVRERLAAGAYADQRLNALADAGKILRVEGRGPRDPDLYSELPAPGSEAPRLPEPERDDDDDEDD